MSMLSSSSSSSSTAAAAAAVAAASATATATATAATAAAATAAAVAAVAAAEDNKLGYSYYKLEHMRDPLLLQEQITTITNHLTFLKSIFSIKRNGIIHIMVDYEYLWAMTKFIDSWMTFKIPKLMNLCIEEDYWNLFIQMDELVDRYRIQKKNWKKNLAQFAKPITSRSYLAITRNNRNYNAVLPSY